MGSTSCSPCPDPTTSLSSERSPQTLPCRPAERQRDSYRWRVDRRRCMSPRRYRLRWWRLGRVSSPSNSSPYPMDLRKLFVVRTVFADLPEITAKPVDGEGKCEYLHGYTDSVRYVCYVSLRLLVHLLQPPDVQRASTNAQPAGSHSPLSIWRLTASTRSAPSLPSFGAASLAVASGARRAHSSLVPAPPPSMPISLAVIRRQPRSILILSHSTLRPRHLPPTDAGNIPSRFVEHLGAAYDFENGTPQDDIHRDEHPDYYLHEPQHHHDVQTLSSTTSFAPTSPSATSTSSHDQCPPVTPNYALPLHLAWAARPYPAVYNATTASSMVELEAEAESRERDS
ncbi:hypothetical protein C8F01DRAFT_1339411 [Mycena amicta]|nr:hypothetical protein C8F01DRAFT_1339411 [Mycena amicta]